MLVPIAYNEIAHPFPMMTIVPIELVEMDCMYAGACSGVVGAL